MSVEKQRDVKKDKTDEEANKVLSPVDFLKPDLLVATNSCQTLGWSVQARRGLDVVHGHNGASADTMEDFFQPKKGTKSATIKKQILGAALWRGASQILGSFLQAQLNTSWLGLQTRGDLVGSPSFGLPRKI